MLELLPFVFFILKFCVENISVTTKDISIDTSGVYRSHLGEVYAQEP